MDTSMNNPLTKSRCIAAAAVNPSESCEYGSVKYYLYCAMGGSMSCGWTHTLLTPLDMVKCRIQVDPKKYKNISAGFKVTFRETGVKGLVRGWAPTYLGYSTQGSLKFGFYEVFKNLYASILGEEYSYLYRTSLYLASSASAEFFANIGLCPFETCKVKIQTTDTFGTTLRECWSKVVQQEGYKGLYKSIVPLWCRQIPYTMTKFACFERTLEALYKYVVPKARSQCSKFEQLMVTFMAGYIAGVFCAAVSHPADTLVSKLNQSKGLRITEVLKQVGFRGLWTGFVPRLIMIGTFTGVEWFIYDGFKVAMRLPRPPPPEMPESLRRTL